MPSGNSWGSMRSRHPGPPLAKTGRNSKTVMSLNQLDGFLAHAEGHPELASRLHDHANPLDLEAFLALAREAGYTVEEADVIAAQIRAEESLSDAELQRRAGEEARRLRHFITG